jgi:hypothetical protein
MRTCRGFVMALVIGAAVALPTGAAANGGALIEFNRTHYRPGETAVATAYVYVAREEQDVFEHGPFFGFLLPTGTSIREGGPIPATAVNLGAFSIEHEKGEQFELRLSFTVPDAAGAFYSVAVCNLPCTTSGFREPLTGLVSIVETRREAELLTKQWRLEARIASLKEDLGKAKVSLATERGRNSSLGALVDMKEEQASSLAGEVDALRTELANVKAATPPRASPSLVEGWPQSAIALALLALAAAVALKRRRGAAIDVPDTVEELERTMEARAER